MLHRRFVIGVLVLLFPVFFIGCKNKVCWTPPPGDDIYFVVKKNGSIIKDDSFLKRISMYYYDNHGTKIDDPGYDDSSFVYLAASYFSGVQEYKGTGIMFMRYLGEVSVDDKVHHFYLEFPDGNVDTVYVKSERVSCQQGWKEECKCTLPLRELKCNGQDAVIDDEYHLSNEQPVYILNKD